MRNFSSDIFTDGFHDPRLGKKQNMKLIVRTLGCNKACAQSVCAQERVDGNPMGHVVD